MANNTIVLKGHGVSMERVANAAISPGHLIELMSTDKFRVHANAGQNAAPIFAVENELEGQDINDDYAATDVVFARVMRPGEEVYGILANGQNASIGSLLESAGDGTLNVHTPDVESIGVNSSGNVASIYTNQIVGMALTALDLSDSSGADPASSRIDVLIF